MRKNAPFLLAVSIPALVACTRSPRSDFEPGDAQDSGTAGSTEAGPSGSDSSDGAPMLDVPGSAGGVDLDPDACASFSAMATVHKRPADILWVVDNSPSMVEEAAAVRERLGSFSEQIVNAGIDVRVFLLTSFPNLALPEALNTGICIEPPLGGGGCPTADNNPPTFGHAQALVGSKAALPELLDSHALWEPMIRDDSAIHVIVVSDDDSGLDADVFDEAFVALDPRHAGYQLHGIVSLQQCSAADTIGSTYIELADHTGGIVGDLCEQQFQPLFDLLSTAVTEGTGLDCAFAVPEAPDGLKIDHDSVEVVYEDDTGNLTTLERMPGPDDCALAPGWYYDDPDLPTTIQACPQTCATMQQAESASVQIDIGCAHKPVG